MAILKAINTSASSRTALSAVVGYVLQGEKINHSEDLVSGVGYWEHMDSDLDRKTVVAEFMKVKRDFGKTFGRYYAHYVISYAPDEFNKDTALQAHAISHEMAGELFHGHQVLCATHIDKDNHIHTHYIVNSVNYLNGKKFHTTKQELDELKRKANEICKKHGLSVPVKGYTHDGYTRAEMTVWNKNKYQTLKAGIAGAKQSYMICAVQAIDYALENSHDKDTWIQEMKNQHYDVVWTDARKNITITDAEGNKMRLSNIAKTFNVPIGTKGELLDEMARRAESRGDRKANSTEREGITARTPEITNTNTEEDGRDRPVIVRP